MHEVAGPATPSGVRSICVILVLYRKSLEDSVAWRTLNDSRGVLGDRNVRFETIVYDNSPESSDAPALPPSTLFVSDPQNHGLAHAYNFALSRAIVGHYDWLLTLDQDTALPVDFLERMLRHARGADADPAIAAIVPQLSEGDILLSPRSVHFARSKAVGRGYLGIAKGEVHAFNSAALWRAEALKSIGGFCEYFWLDHLDIWTHHRLHQAGCRVFIAGDLQLQHTLSLLDYKARMTVDRYAWFLQAEGGFTDLCKPWLERSAYNCRLVIRFFRQRMRHEAPEIGWLTLKTVTYRLLTRRRKRVAQWKDRAVSNPHYGGERTQPVRCDLE